MSAAQADPIIADAKRRMLAAAELYARAAAELQPARRALERHPDFVKASRKMRAGAAFLEALTPAYWLRECIISAAEVGADEVARCLTDDATGGAERSMLDAIETEARDLAARARRKGRRASVAA